MVYVLNINGQPIMPTENHAKVRALLKQGKAKVIHRCPFTIQLLYETENGTQSVSLGIDAGSKHIGVSATTEKKVLYEADVELRNDIVNLLSTRRECRRARRNRKTRYRKARFLNHRKDKGWLAPSIQQKVDTHLTVARKICELLPITKIVVETASFDIQKIKNPEIQNKEYQQGNQLGFWNVREYVLWRDGHKCQRCNGKSKDKILNVHHIESRKTGGNAPNNLVTLCETCHKKYHQHEINLPKTIKRGMKFDNEAFMGIMRCAFYNKLKEMYPNVHMTYGYITKNTRIKNGLQKTHYIDARCISGNPTAQSDGIVFYQRKVRCHNRQIHKMSILKGGVRKKNQAPIHVKGFKLFDLVEYKKQQYTVFGRRLSGFFDIRTLNGEKVNKGSINCKKLKLIARQDGFITEQRKEKALPLMTKVTSPRA